MGGNDPPTAAKQQQHMHVGGVGGSDPPTAAKAQPYHHLPNTTNQYKFVLHYNCEQELMGIKHYVYTGVCNVLHNYYRHASVQAILTESV